MYENNHMTAIFDEFPVSKGHVLIISRKHYKDWFEIPSNEKYWLNEAIEHCKNIIECEFNPTGFNIGMNCGADAGQTVMHFHCHLIPRYNGDTASPQGGVRGVIPERMSY